MSSNWLGFCDRTGIHGFAYLSDPDLNLVGKAFWAVVIVVGLW